MVVLGNGPMMRPVALLAFVCVLVSSCNRVASKGDAAVSQRTGDKSMCDYSFDAYDCTIEQAALPNGIDGRLSLASDFRRLISFLNSLQLEPIRAMAPGESMVADGWATIRFSRKDNGKTVQCITIEGRNLYMKGKEWRVQNEDVSAETIRQMIGQMRWDDTWIPNQDKLPRGVSESDAKALRVALQSGHSRKYLKTWFGEILTSGKPQKLLEEKVGKNNLTYFIMCSSPKDLLGYSVTLLGSDEQLTNTLKKEQSFVQLRHVGEFEKAEHPSGTYHGSFMIASPNVVGRFLFIQEKHDQMRIIKLAIPKEDSDSIKDALIVFELK